MAFYDHFLQIDHLSKWFATEHGKEPIHVIDDVSMTIEGGDFVVFVGPSGCGKTTLMRIVAGLETTSEGRIVLEGEEVKGPDRKKGVVFQSYSSFPWLTVFENARFGLKFRDDVTKNEKDGIARHYLELVGLAGFEDFYVNRISGGMRQRLAIARTLAAGPDILLMDEPFGALDAQNREFLQVQLLEIRAKERKTIIFVTHDVEEAIFLAERIFVFSARPAKIIEEITVSDHLVREASLELKETEAFFKLRNHLMAVCRAQAQRTEAMIMSPNAAR
ncbi:MAG: ABC transporter ATP-binding protein [Proteobacteria bacterium]|nr:ABC transporter ATP-binding protein [Pseudomonadota bacterium]